VPARNSVGKTMLGNGKTPELEYFRDAAIRNSARGQKPQYEAAWSRLTLLRTPKPGRHNQSACHQKTRTPKLRFAFALRGAIAGDYTFSS
jgi:hypothetical protein